MTSTATPPARDSAFPLPARPGDAPMMNAVLSGAGSAVRATDPKSDIATVPAPVLRHRRRLVLLALLAGLLLGGLVGVVIGPRSLSPGPLISGDPQLATDFPGNTG